MTAAIDAFQKAMPAAWSKIDGAGALWFAKAGARHSKKDVEMIQNMHDTAIALGAACKRTTPTTEKHRRRPPLRSSSTIEKVAATPATPVAPVVAPAPVEAPAVEPPAPRSTNPTSGNAATAAVPVAEPSEDRITKLIESEAVTKAMEAQQATHASVVAELQKRVKELEDQPMPGGPKTRATRRRTDRHAGRTSGSPTKLQPRPMASTRHDVRR
jgi:hypothetical protein